MRHFQNVLFMVGHFFFGQSMRNGDTMFPAICSVPKVDLDFQARLDLSTKTQMGLSE